ncbi:hypothetical protein ACIBI9_46500 [Nonomuraea sp. NPDC050451]|uniref:hypothetical protein n=1 Tax=Nonomuraea sp. NPDC050451 TaxID=3364364 RepID=UPI00379F6A50
MASWAAPLWAGTTALTVLFALSDLLAVPVSGLTGALPYAELAGEGPAPVAG